MILHRVFDASEFNALVNHPSIYPWVNGRIVGPLDLSDVASDPANVFLLGEHGGIEFISLQPAIYDVHAQCLTEGRGAWMADAANEAAWWMFTRTDALEIVARVSHGNRRVRALANVCGMRKQFTVENGWVLDHRIVPADIYSLTLQEWLANSVHVGKMADRLKERLTKSPVASTVNLSDGCARTIAVTLEMIRYQQVGKAVVFHDRFAAMARVPMLNIVSQSPIAVEIGGLVFVMRKDDYFIASVGASHTEIRRAS